MTFPVTKSAGSSPMSTGGDSPGSRCFHVIGRPVEPNTPSNAICNGRLDRQPSTHGSVNALRATVARDAEGKWIYNGQARDAVAGCLDIDLNFSPSTNLLPIRRLGLDIGASARVRAAWLRFPSFTLEPLEQTYLRLSETRYRYESAGGSFVAQVNVDDAGLVVDYGEVWSRE